MISNPLQILELVVRTRSLIGENIRNVGNTFAVLRLLGDDARLIVLLECFQLGHVRERGESIA